MKILAKLALKVRGNLNKSGDYNYVYSKEMGIKIPKVIHQTYYNKTLPVEIEENINLIKSMNPDWIYKLYDDADIEEYIKMYFPELVQIYQKINPIYGAARADFFRYLVIYNEGGVYLDIKSSLSKPLNEIIRSEDRYLLSHWQDDYGAHDSIANPMGEFQQWHVVAVKGHPFLKRVIDKVCNNIMHYSPFIHDTGAWAVINLTGPIAYTLAITPVLTNSPHRLERDNTYFGFIYSIYESQGIHQGHYKLSKKYYRLSDDSLILLPFLSNLIFKSFKPALKFTKKILSKYL